MRPLQIQGIGKFRRHRLDSFLGVLILSVALVLPLLAAETPAIEPVAEVNGEAITTKDLESSLGAKLAELEEQIYDLKREKLDSLITQKLFAQEAAKRKI